MFGLLAGKLLACVSARLPSGPRTLLGRREHGAERSTRVTCQKVWQGYTLVDGHEGQGSFQRQRERKRWRGEDHPSVSVTTVVFLDTSRSLTLDLLEAQLE